jgi:hypothetical protein
VRFRYSLLSIAIAGFVAIEGCGPNAGAKSSTSPPAEALSVTTAAPPSAQAKIASASPSSAPARARKIRVEIAESVGGVAIVREPVGAKDTVETACARLSASPSFKAIVAPQNALVRCGGEPGKGPWGAAESVRSVAVSTSPVLTQADLGAPEVWYDEDTVPLHAHVVCTLAEPALARWMSFAKAHKGAEIAVVIDDLVAEVQTVAAPGMEPHFWITPAPRAGEMSNDDVAKEIAASLRIWHAT